MDDSGQDRLRESNSKDSLELPHEPIFILSKVSTPISIADPLNKDESSKDSDDDIANLDVTKLEELPSLEVLINSFHDFKVKQNKSGTNEFYRFSVKSNRVFTSTDKSITFDMSMNPHTPLIIRSMLVCCNQVYTLLARCSYHIRGDNTMFRDHVVTHKDAAAKYVGTASGIYFRERLAILVPIEETGQKSISLELKCLSSCYKIRKIATALVFTLEDENSNNILGRQLFNVHVTKNFKRDMEVAEKNSSLKRKLFESEEAGPSSTGDTFVDLSDLKFLLPEEVVGDFLEHNQQFFNDENVKQSLSRCLEKVDDIISNFNHKRKMKDNSRMIGYLEEPNN